MKTLTELKYIAIVSKDRSGPAYGIGRTEHQARTNAANYGFLFRDGIAVEISERQYNAVLAGNPDAWALEPKEPEKEEEPKGARAPSPDPTLIQ